jgi:peptide/nickel transport system substrate-binding protein
MRREHVARRFAGVLQRLGPRRRSGRITLFLAVGTSLTMIAAASTLAAGSKPAAARAVVDPNGALNVAFHADVKTLDTRKMIASPWRDVAIQIYEGLVTKNWREDPDGKNIKIIPGLAESWTISKDRRTYTFKLRKGVTFHDGTPFDARAVDFNFRTWWDKRFKYYDKDARAAAGANIQLIKSFAPAGKYVFRITLTRSFGSFLDRLTAASNLFFVSPKVIQTYPSDQISSHAAGTGPFRVVKWSPGQGVVLQRYDKYWGQKAAYKSLILRFVPDQAARVAALQSGEVQAATAIPAQNAQVWANRSDIRVVVRKRAASFMCQYNGKEGPAVKAGVREAVSLSVDRAKINRLVFGGRSVPSSGYYTPGMVSYDPKLKPLPFSVAKAKQVLSAAGYPNGVRLKFVVAINPNQQDVINIAQEGFKAAGINVDVQYMDLGTFLSTLYTPGLKPNSGIDALCLIVGGDEDFLFSSYFSTYGWPPKGSFNPGYYSNPAVEQAVNQAVNASNTDAYIAGLRRANAAMVADSGGLFFIPDLNVFGLASNVDWKAPVRIRIDFTTAKVLKK